MKIHWASTLLVLSLCTGCGTICSHNGEGLVKGGVYQGVRFDARVLSHSDIGWGKDQEAYDDPSFVGVSICYAVWDLPLSAMADTVVLPVDLLK
jgi:uncharacterized protein YceK